MDKIRQTFKRQYKISNNTERSGDRPKQANCSCFLVRFDKYVLRTELLHRQRQNNPNILEKSYFW